MDVDSQTPTARQEGVESMNVDTQVRVCVVHVFPSPVFLD